MRKLSFTKQLALTAVLTMMTSSMAMAQLAATRVLNVGPCKVYQSDSNDDPTRGGSVLIKCPQNSVGEYRPSAPTTPFPRTTDGVAWNSFGATDIVSYNPGAPGSKYDPWDPAGSNLLEFAIGQPAGFTPHTVTLDGKTVITSYKQYQCPYNVPGTYQAQRNVTLDGGLAHNLGGEVCGPKPRSGGRLPIVTSVE